MMVHSIRVDTNSCAASACNRKAAMLVLLALTAWIAAPASVAGAEDSEPGSDKAAPKANAVDMAVDELHAKLFLKDRFPSAKACARCHINHYREWSVSQHAYAQVSPVFNAMHGTIFKLTNGTFGDFCIRCHTPVGMTMGEPIFTENAKRSAVSREGVTCVVCHRVSKSYGKISGRMGFDQGDITQPVQGPSGDNSQIKRLVEEGVVADTADAPGRKIHSGSNRFFQMTKASFCASCHDVNFVTGFRLEEAFSHYKSSPAAKRGTTCQDCHMGKEPGRYTGDPMSNYAWGPAARVGGEWTRPRKLTNHMIVGPDYSIFHPAIFPHTRDAVRDDSDDEGGRMGFATIDEWLQFDHKAGWGTDEFEDKVTAETKFPKRWQSVDDRIDARDIVDDNLELLATARQARITLLKNGFTLSEIDVFSASDNEIRFRLDVGNGTDGHSVPTGFDADRPVWLSVVVKDKDGKVVFKSGDLDPNGDVRDLHSAYVHNGELPLDTQLFSLQSRFITRNLRGGEREQVLTVNHSATPLPFARPARRPSILFGQPTDARKHRMSINAGAKRTASYRVKGRGFDARGPLRITAELKAGMVPVNLVNAVKDVGFDYKMSARDVAEAVVAGHEVIWRRELVVNVSDDE